MGNQTSSSKYQIYRGLNSAEELEAILTQKTAGGFPADKNIGAPTEQEALHEIAHAEHGLSREAGTFFKDHINPKELLDYTNMENIARSFARPFYIFVEVKAKYCTPVVAQVAGPQDQQDEGNILLYRSAPLEAIKAIYLKESESIRVAEKLMPALQELAHSKYKLKIIDF